MSVRSGRGVSRLRSLSMLSRLKLLPSSQPAGSGELESKLRPSPLAFPLLSGVGGVKLCGIDEAVELWVGDLGVGCVGGGGGGNCACCEEAVGVGVAPVDCTLWPCRLAMTCCVTCCVI